MHALIIEDEPMIALLIEDYLRDLGFTSIDFAVGQAGALAAALAHRPDLITSDVALGADGCGIAAVEAISMRMSIPVIFITATPIGVRRRLPHALSWPSPSPRPRWRRPSALAAQLFDQPAPD